MAILILDPATAAAFRTQHESDAENRHDEVWDGVLVVPPMPSSEHQALQLALAVPLYETITVVGLGTVYPGVNVTDRHPNWRENYRAPDIAVYLAANPATNHGTHWLGGPDFLVEILSPGEKAYDKFGFYAQVSTREVLIVDRDPWGLELHELRGEQLTLVGRSTLANPARLGSSIVPLTFQLVPGTSRPQIEVRHPTSGKSWLA